MELINIIKTIKVPCELAEGSFVEFYTDIPMYVASETYDDASKRGTAIIVSVVKDWNFADENGEKIPVTKDGVGRLPSPIANWLVEQAVDIISPDDSKKK
jgi:hypothetical protein